MPSISFHSLTFKLVLAFVVVCILAVGIVAVATSQVTHVAFNSYVEHDRLMNQMMGNGFSGTGMMGRANTMLQAGPGDAEKSFLESVNRSLWLAGLGSGVVAILLSLLLARQIVAPLSRLTHGAQRIAGGDLLHRVRIEGKDEIGQLAAAFDSMAESLSRSEETRRHMLADVAHELRTPVSIIQGSLEAMMDGVLPATADNMASAHEETKLLARLISDLREISLAEAGQLRLEVSSNPVRDLLTHAVEVNQPEAAARQIALDWDGRDGFSSVSVDRDRFGQIMNNLVANALRYTPPGGTVTIGAELRAESNATCGMVRFMVTDSGCGIPPSELAHVFDRFYRVDKSRTRASGGSGLGLALVRQLVEAHGGSVWAESVEGSGSTFSFTIPAASQQGNSAITTT